MYPESAIGLNRSCLSFEGNRMGAKQLKNYGLMNKTEFVSSDYEMLINSNLNSDLVYTVVYY